MTIPSKRSIKEKNGYVCVPHGTWLSATEVAVMVQNRMIPTYAAISSFPTALKTS